MTDRGREKIGAGLVNRVWHYEMPEQLDETQYKSVVRVNLFECTANWCDRPCTSSVANLHEKFGIPYDATLGRYFIRVSPEVDVLADESLKFLRAVGIHFNGQSNPAKKDLSREELTAICGAIQSTNRVPVLFDWRNRVDPWTLAKLGAISASGLQLDGADVEHVAALISKCEAFIGIDSGPAKCASATDTPALVIWKGHHPLFYHDPAPNTFHLVPEHHEKMMPAGGRSDRMAEYFQSAYRFGTYTDLVKGVREWLATI